MILEEWPYSETLLNRQDRQCQYCDVYVPVGQQWIGFAAIFHRRCIAAMHEKDRPHVG